MAAAVITGLGIVSVGGLDTDAVWEHLIARKRHGMGLIDGFDPATVMPRRQARRLARFAQMAVAASDQALRQAGLAPSTSEAGSDGHPVPAERTGVVLASVYGGMSAVEEANEALRTEGPSAVSPLIPIASAGSSGAAAIAAHVGASGPAWSLNAACASGGVAIGQALDWIRLGRADVVVCGGADSTTSIAMQAALENLRVLGEDGSRPFAIDRDGFGCSEGAAMVVVESEAHAAARGATVLARLAGSATTTELGGQWAPSSDAAEVVRCVRLALADAGVDAADVRQLNAHGTGTVPNDRAEAAAVRELFGPECIVTSNKGGLGHSGGAAGAVEAVCSVLSIVTGVVPPTAGVEEVDPELGIDVAVEPRPWGPAPMVSTSLGLGGHISALVLAPPDPA
jgi:3-oxoacyl-[acyl-carrier-protein] synthase II